MIELAVFIANPPTKYNLEEAVMQLPQAQQSYLNEAQVAAAQKTTADFKKKLGSIPDDEESSEQVKHKGPATPPT